jgi:hypothetical protein
MDITECIRQYEAFGDRVFRRSRWWRLTKYNYKDLEEIVRTIIMSNCLEGHQSNCQGDHPLEQHDYAEIGPHRKNMTCRV